MIQSNEQIEMVKENFCVVMLGLKNINLDSLSL